MSVKITDKIRPLLELGKHLGMFKEGNINLNLGVKIVDDIDE